LPADVLIRRYQPGNREAVRKICCDTADCGEPVENFFHDREFIADLVTRYYTDFEPQSSWVAESGGKVVGYLNGSLDSRRSQRITIWRIAPAVVLFAVARGALWRRETWRWFRAMLRTLRSGGAQRSPLFAEYPAHLHVNVDKSGRGQQIGQQLVERFFEQVKAAGLSGVHASVRGDNAGGRKFFEQLGFTEVARRPMILPKNDGWLDTYSVIYGKKM
jgi:ribosomal protein S18 acetylase RimI-like enzyme